MVEIASKTYGTTIVPAGLRRKREDPNLTRDAVVRVRATDEKYRRVLKHGITRVGFLPDIGQSVEWPNDTFTHRRLKEGSVVLDESSSGGERQPERAARNKREQPKQPAD